ncbi:MAG: LacI family DNA-binding transcriptional regulator [Marinibacterium sp.]
MADKPKLETVANRAGVSTATASQVLRGTGRISDKTRKRVLKAASDLFYVPDGRAAAMRSGETREIGFVINQLSNPFNAEVVSGVVDLLEGEGYLVSILDARDDAERQSRHVEAFIRHGRGGLLWVPAHDSPPEIFNLLAAHRIPAVSFLRPGCRDMDHVGIRDAEATATATAHLIDLGHRCIAFLGGTDLSWVRQERIAGYQRVMTQNGLGPGIVWPSADSKIAGLAATEDLLRAHPAVTALVCKSDMVALGACLGAVRAGLQLGRDLSVVGFDDVQDAAVASTPLTTMAVAPDKLGNKLARVLLDRINDPDMPVTVSEISARLVVRGTTGAPAPREFPRD